MLKKMIQLVIIATLSVFVLTGCASNASADRMIYKKKVVAKPKNSSLINNINLSAVSGGKETNPLWTSQVNNENFQKALEQSLIEARLYHKLHGEKYRLKADLIKLEQPVIGFNFTVTSRVHYTLQNLELNKIIYNKDITASYTATVGDSLSGVARLKMANEGAIRGNIQQLIKDLYHL